MAMKADELLRPLTYADLDAYDDPSLRYEIINGELVVSPAPSADHGQIIIRLIAAFWRIIDRDKLGRIWTAPGDVELGAHNIFQPDIYFVAQARRGIVKGRVLGSPDLAIEVVSPSSRRRDYVAKRAQYETMGVKEYWIVDPMRRSVTVLVLENGVYVSDDAGDGFARSTIVPGVEVEVFPLFEDL
jgi:Uma2 family endonuclease